MSAPLPLCEFCQKEIDPRLPGVKRHVDGWEDVRGGAGGGHGLSLRKVWGHYAHSLCVDEQSKKSLPQDSLF